MLVVNAEETKMFDAVRRVLRLADQANELAADRKCEWQRTHSSEAGRYDAAIAEICFGLGMLAIALFAALIAAVMIDVVNKVLFSAFSLVSLIGSVIRLDRIGRAFRAK